MSTHEIEILKQKVFKDLEATCNFLLKETTNMMLKIVFRLTPKPHLPGGRLHGRCRRTHSCIALHQLRASAPPTEELTAKPNQRETRRLPSRSLHLEWTLAPSHPSKSQAEAQPTHIPDGPLSSGRVDITE